MQPHLTISLSPVCTREPRGMPDPHVENFEWSQRTADAARGLLGIGTSACAYIHAKLMVHFCKVIQQPGVNRECVAEAVREYDGKTGEADGGSNEDR